MASNRCPVYNHEQYVSSDDNDHFESDNLCYKSNSHHRQHRQLQNDHSKPNNLHTESRNHNLAPDNDNSQPNSDYSTEDEEDVLSDSDNIQENDNKINSVGEERSVNEEGDEKDTLPEIMVYSRHHKRNRARKYSHKRPHRRLKYSRIRLPTGQSATISKPHTSGWKCGRRTKLITLKKNGRIGRREYNMVEHEMKETMNNKKKILCTIIPIPIACNQLDLRIIKIQKIVNGCLWRKYREYQEIVRREVGYANERLLFHGTSKAKELLKHGFDERFASMRGMFGAGIYFAEHSGKSNKYVFGLNAGCKAHHNQDCTICIRQMFLCRVTLGKVEATSMPKTFAHAPPGKHSVEGTPGMVLEYPEHVIYRGEQAYPEYLITYKQK